MRLASATSTVSAVGWQVGVVILFGLGAAWFVGHASPVVVLGALLTIGVGVIFLQRPEVFLILLLAIRASTDLALSYLGNIGAQGGQIGMLMSPNVALVIVLSLVGGLLILRHRIPFISLPGGGVFVLLLLVGFVGVLRSDSVLFTMREWVPGVSSLVVFALVAHFFRDSAGSRRIVDALAVSFVLPASFGLYQLVTGVGNIHRLIGVARIVGTFTHPNPFGLYLVTMLSVFLPQLFTQSGRRKWLSLFIVLASLALLVGTFARFAWVGALVALFAIGVLRRPILLIVAPLIAAVVFGAVPAVSARLEDPLGGSLAHRLFLWRTLVHEWLQTTSLSQAPIAVAMDRIAGLGPGAWAPLFSEAGTRIFLPHNDYIRVLVEYGVFGLVLYVILFVVLIRLAYRVWTRSVEPAKSVALSFLALTLAYPVMSLTANILAQTVNQIYFWSLAGVVLAIGEMSGGQQLQSASRPRYRFREAKLPPAPLRA